MNMLLISRHLILLAFSISSVSCQRWFNITPEFKNIPINNGSMADVAMQIEFNQLVANSPMMNVEMTYFTIFRWQDDRFVRKGSTDPSKKYVTLYGNDDDFQNLWIPDVYFLNEIPSGILDFVPSDSIRIYENGTLKMSKRHITLFYCRIRLFKLPMTLEVCPVEFQSSSYTSKEMNLTWWSYNPITFSPNFVAIVSKISHVDTTKCASKPNAEEEELPCLFANINVEQVYKGFVVQVYLPSTAIVLMLWLSFWVSLKEVSSRVRVVTVAFVATVTQMVAVMVVFPDTVQLEPILIWNGFCLIMNLLAFIEFVYVHNLYITREVKRKLDKNMVVTPPEQDAETGFDDSNKIKRSSKQKNGKSIMYFTESSDTTALLSSKRKRKQKSGCCSRWSTPYRMDKICMVLYLLLFLFFNAGYWMYYLY